MVLHVIVVAGSALTPGASIVAWPLQETQTHWQLMTTSSSLYHHHLLSSLHGFFLLHTDEFWEGVVTQLKQPTLWEL